MWIWQTWNWHFSSGEWWGLQDPLWFSNSLSWKKKKQKNKKEDTGKSPAHTGKDLGVPNPGLDLSSIQHRSSVPYFSSSFPFFCVWNIENSLSPRHLGELVGEHPQDLSSVCQRGRENFVSLERDANSLFSTPSLEILVGIPSWSGHSWPNS